MRWKTHTSSCRSFSRAIRSRRYYSFSLLGDVIHRSQIGKKNERIARVITLRNGRGMI